MKLLGRQPLGGHPRGEVLRGFGLGVLLHVVVLGLWAGLSSDLPAGLLAIGLFQLLYVVPAAVWLQLRGRKGMVHGLFLLTTVTFLLNAACFGLVIATF